MPIIGIDAAKKEKPDYLQREEEVRYSEVEKANAQFNVVSPIKQIVYVHKRRGETLLKLWRSVMRNIHISR